MMTSEPTHVTGLEAIGIDPAKPTHVVAHPGDRHSLCGVKDPLPVVLAQFVDAHVSGYGMVVCADCGSHHTPEERTRMTPRPEIILCDASEVDRDSFTRHIKGVDCPNEAAHQPMPHGYAEKADEMTRLERTHRQHACPGCGRFAIWKKRA